MLSRYAALNEIISPSSMVPLSIFNLVAPLFLDDMLGLPYARTRVKSMTSQCKSLCCYLRFYQGNNDAFSLHLPITLTDVLSRLLMNM